MRARNLLCALLCACIAAALTPVPASAAELTVTSVKTVKGVKFPESVGYDPVAKVLYVSEFVTELKPTQKDGAGRISKLSLQGMVLEQNFLPGPGQVLNKPKGIWVAGDRLWVTDIDSVWVFDTKTRQGRKVELPGVQFANDPAVLGKALYVSDNRGDQLYRVEPADFLAGAAPKVTRVFAGKAINPNGVFPGKDGALLMVGFKSGEEPRGIYAMKPGGEPKALAEGLGRLDGLYQMANGDLLVTDWSTGALGVWRAKTGLQTLVSGFKGPADFAVVPGGGGLQVIVPDLVKSEIRMIQLGR